MNKILVVEDDKDINDLVVEILKKSGYDSYGALNVREANLFLQIHDFDLILLDLMMPEVSGEEFLEELRKNKKLPVIVLSAKIAKESKINVLKMGADAFIEKPFDKDELLAVVEAVIRRYKDFNEENHEDKNEISYRDIHIDLNTMAVEVKGEAIKLTPIEYKILLLLMKNPDRIYTRENLYEEVWEDEYFYDSDTINAHISNLRSKIKKVSGENYIETVWSIGYKLK
ncbi:response regulator transcription factor [Peptoniphilus sp.]|jgi:DNA-binding response OmpR family regulator|uniref:response regulator transcription factor n=1 Tax=Peptoniphilus sp. TaxID=1971214 RepID=UPI003D8A1386